jgi:riboflavin kinase/FMN adenylyltransferase
MRVFRNLGEIPSSFGATVVSIGNFDGVHRGHQEILSHLVERASVRSIQSLAVTFDPHPLRVLRPASSPKLITPLPMRLELLQATGISAVLVLSFTPELSCMRAEEFATRILHHGLRAVEVHEGPNFRFGHRAEGGPEELRRLGSRLGFDVVVHPVCRFRGHEVSSTRIRELISLGDLGTARLLLGHGFCIRSTPAAGRGIGTALTVPTINLAPYPELLPANGVYVTRLRVAEEWLDAVTNVGVRPTFGEDSFAVESHLLNFHPLDLTSETPLELAFCRRIREERRWPSPEALKAQILRDVDYARRYLRLLHVLEGPGFSRAVKTANSKRL